MVARNSIRVDSSSDLLQYFPGEARCTCLFRSLRMHYGFLALSTYLYNVGLEICIILQI